MLDRPNKLEQTYVDVLEFLKQVCVSAGFPLDFLYVHSDAERGILNAVKQCFPLADHRICHFHVADAIRRHMMSLGLKVLLKTHKDFFHFYEDMPPHFLFPQRLVALSVVQ